MLTAPNNIKFEDSMDVVDYVSKGFVPTKKNFRKLMESVQLDDMYRKYDDFPVIVDEKLFDGYDKDTMCTTLEQVYKNRKSNTIATVALMIGLGVVAFLFGSGHGYREAVADMPEPIELDDIPVIDIEDMR